jgi:hypothetical protein
MGTGGTRGEVSYQAGMVFLQSEKFENFPKQFRPDTKFSFGETGLEKYSGIIF